jgi:hypothetical protein
MKDLGSEKDLGRNTQLHAARTKHQRGANIWIGSIRRLQSEAQSGTIAVKKKPVGTSDRAYLLDGIDPRDTTVEGGEVVQLEA